MKIRIQGCTAEELAEYSPYLSLGKVYEAKPMGLDIYSIKGDGGEDVETVVCAHISSCHLPKGAKWVEVTE